MFRTNFKDSDLPKYKKAIAEYESLTNDKRLTIEDHAYDCFDNLMPDNYSLHDSKTTNLLAFWKVFDTIHIITDREMHLNMQYYMEYCENNDYVTPQVWIEKHKHF